MKFSGMTLLPSIDKSGLMETSLTAITEQAEVQNTAVPILYTDLVPNMTVDQQQTEITQIAPEPSSATPTLQETLDKMMSRITQMENTMLQIQANLPKLQ